MINMGNNAEIANMCRVHLKISNVEFQIATAARSAGRRNPPNKAAQHNRHGDEGKEIPLPCNLSVAPAR
jgi:hypothetical protein